MVRSPRLHRRPGYTLLEVLVATAIALLLLAGLYVALDVTLVRMDVSREQVTVNDLSRAVVNRVAADLANTLGPLPPKSGGESAGASTTGSLGSGSAAAGTGAATGTGAPMGGTGTGTGAATGGGTGTGAAAGAGTGAGAAPMGEGDAAAPTGDGTAAEQQTLLPFGMGLCGNANQFTAFGSRLPAALVDPEAAASQTTLPGDGRRVCYYMASDGSGLCRQERPWVTADGVGTSVEPDRSTEADDLIAPEVKGFDLEYYDGGSWMSTWDGAVTDLDGVSLTGPPRAVRVTLTLEIPGRGGSVVQRKVQHTIAVRAAVGNYQGPEPPPVTPEPETTSAEGS